MQRRIESVALAPTPEPDQTIEILMTELDPQVMAIFTKEECDKAKDATEVSVKDFFSVLTMYIGFFDIFHRDLAFIKYCQEW